MAKQKGEGRLWYVVHTYSGYEETVKKNLEQRIESMDMEDKIFNVLIPTEKKIKIKNGKRHVVVEKIFPGYVFVEMELSDESWYVVRNTPNVTGFIGSGTTPTPVSPEEMEMLKKKMGMDVPKYNVNFEIGDLVKITDGPFKDFEGNIDSIDSEKGKVKVLVSVFGRETPVELDLLQIKKAV
ncbi:MAG TPA: transcription termination/antitermination protein NusG [bacterium]|nr:transcription termination/antitermination protein NusG [Bacteroidales bacterium]MBP8689517.1 transcription termination/antitermination protein NusG [Patescibacteria group bacterium]HOC96294.1 transcription termination/antitermination protein NusG [bacterium]HPO10967.1 transcription termination/antitermination protein NusG [bacterium]HQL11562.1 transcription termination/antitermination protein NusG [bacterium]